MRFLQIVNGEMSGPRDAAHIAKMRASIGEAIASGSLLATGGLGKRATAAARVSLKDGKISVEDPPSGDGWMAAGGYSLTEFASKDDAIADARKKLEMMGGGVVELIQVGEMHPPPKPSPAQAGGINTGVIPYLNVVGAEAAAELYKTAFGAREHHRMLAQDGKRLMHIHLEINGGSLMMSDAFPEFGHPHQPSNSFTMTLVLADGRTWWDRAVKAGLEIVTPFEKQMWGDTYGQLRDRFGVNWAINQPTVHAPAQAGKA